MYIAKIFFYLNWTGYHFELVGHNRKLKRTRPGRNENVQYNIYYLLGIKKQNAIRMLIIVTDKIYTIQIIL